MSEKGKMEVLPDYNNCLVNILASVAKYFGVSTGHSTMKIVDAELKRKPKNIVVMVLDGMGSNVLRHTLSADAFLRVNKVKDISSVFPSATTPAITSYITGQEPIEHGWLARNAYFKEAGAVVSMFNNTDAFSLKAASKNIDIAHTVLPHASLLERISERNAGSVRTYSVYPAKTRGPYGHTQLLYTNLEEMMSFINILTETDEDKLILSYYSEPDSVIHDYGTNAKYVVDVMFNINRVVEGLVKQLRDTLFIITADHGLTNIAKHVDLSQIKELNDLLVMPPSMEERATTFFVKTGKTVAFEEAFNAQFKDKFILLTHNEVLDKKLFGTGRQHPKVQEFLGDFMAIAVSDWDFTYSTIHELYELDKKGNHSGLTEDEVIVPLIMINKK